MSGLLRTTPARIGDGMAGFQARVAVVRRRLVVSRGRKCLTTTISYQNALRHQPHLAVLAQPVFKGIALALFVSGQVFVVTSIYALGIVGELAPPRVASAHTAGTYLGDYCGILMKERVTGFPFNVLEDPMYVGSTLAFLGTAIW